MGQGGRRTALILALALGGAGREAWAVETSSSSLTIVAEAGTPFSSVRGRWAFASWLAVGPRFDLVETVALRTGLETRATEYDGSLIALYTDVYLARAFGVTVESSWDAEIDQWVRARIFDRWFAALRLGAIGYAGREVSQRGVIALGSGRVGFQLDQFFDLGVELGRMGNAHSTRTLASISIDHHF